MLIRIGNKMRETRNDEAIYTMESVISMIIGNQLIEVTIQREFSSTNSVGNTPDGGSKVD